VHIGKKDAKELTDPPWKEARNDTRLVPERLRRHDPVRRYLYASDTVINRTQKRLLVGEDGFASGDVSENLR
jgi:hypothetical protein